MQTLMFIRINHPTEGTMRGQIKMPVTRITPESAILDHSQPGFLKAGKPGVIQTAQGEIETNSIRHGRARQGASKRLSPTIFQKCGQG